MAGFVGFEEPEGLVEVAGDGGDEVGGVFVAGGVGGVDGFAGGIGGYGVAVDEGVEVGGVAGGFGGEFLELGVFGGVANGAAGDLAEGGDALGDGIEVLLDHAREAIEEEVELVEAGTAEVPVGLLGLAVEVAAIGEGLVEGLGGFCAGLWGEAVFGFERGFHVGVCLNRLAGEIGCMRWARRGGGRGSRKEAKAQRGRGIRRFSAVIFYGVGDCFTRRETGRFS